MCLAMVNINKWWIGLYRAIAQCLAILAQHCQFPLFLRRSVIIVPHKLQIQLLLYHLEFKYLAVAHLKP